MVRDEGNLDPRERWLLLLPLAGGLLFGAGRLSATPSWAWA